MEYLLDMSEVRPDGQDSLTGETALTVAACNGCHTVCTALLNRGANISVPNQKVGETNADSTRFYDYVEGILSLIISQIIATLIFEYFSF